MSEMEIGQIDLRVPRRVKVWRGVLNWVVFFVEILIQVLKGTPSLISYVVGLSTTTTNNRSLLVSSHSHSNSHSSISFKPLPVIEVPLQEISVNRNNGDRYDRSHDDRDHQLEKLTVIFQIFRIDVMGCDFMF